MTFEQNLQAGLAQQLANPPAQNGNPYQSGSFQSGLYNGLGAALQDQKPWAPGYTGTYANETYMKALEASAADIKRQIEMAVKEVTTQRQLFQKNARAVRGAAEDTLSAGKNALAGDLASIGLGVDPALSGIFRDDAESYRRVANLLSDGYGDQWEQRQGRVDTIGQDLLAQLSMQGTTYIADRQREQRGQAFTAEENARQQALQESIANQQAALQQQLLAQQSAEAQRQRDWEAQQNLLNRQSQESLTNLLLQPVPQPALLPYPYPYPYPEQQPVPTSQPNQYGVRDAGNGTFVSGGGNTGRPAVRFS